MEMILKNIKNSLSLINEIVACETIISPIIREVADNNNLSVWSHAPFNVDESKKLIGIPDYLIGSRDIDDVSFKSPVVCLGEAKQEKFKEAWGQVVSEMYAAQIANNNKEVPIYGLVSTAKTWEFARLKNDFLTIDPKCYTIPLDLQSMLEALNWMFCEARKSIDILDNINQ